MRGTQCNEELRYQFCITEAEAEREREMGRLDEE
jgi:hypothetical protein